MTVSDYKFNMRKYRGHLKSMDTELEAIYEFGISRFIDWTLANKAIGVAKMAYIADNLGVDKQNEFLDWMNQQARTKNEIDTKLMEMI